MVKLSKLLQKLSITFSLLVMEVFTIYTFGFYTPLSPLQYLQNYFPDVKFFFEKGSFAQYFNRQILLFAIIGICIVGLMYFFNTHKRKKFYLSNYLLSFAYLLLTSYTFIYLNTNLPILKEKFLKIDFNACQDDLLCVNILESYWIPKSAFVFDLGTAISYIILISGLLIISNAIMKFILNKKENKLKEELKVKIGVQ